MAKIPRTPARVEAEIREIEPLAALWRTPGFREWVERVDHDVARIESAQWGQSAQEVHHLLRDLGFALGETSPPDLLSLFLQARAVVRFWKSRTAGLREAGAKLERLHEEKRGHARTG
jgi:hypothetical protein